MTIQLPQPDAADQVHPFDPSTADRERVDAERARERRVRTDQGERIALDLAKRGLDYEAIIARTVTADPEW